MDEKSLSQLQLEHLEVAKSFSGPFTASEFQQRYREMYPNRATGSILPSDYSFNNNNDPSYGENYPWFLERLDRARYRFIGLSAGEAHKKRNPNWTRDELILAVEFYKQFAPSIPGKTDDRLVKLSEEIRAVATSLGLHGDETFRNPNGVYMKLMEIRKYDPTYSGKGLGRSLRPIEQGVWDLPGETLAAAAKTIRAALDGLEIGSTPKEGVTDAAEPEIEDAPEGALLTRLHRYRERNRQLVNSKKKQFLKKHGRLHCEACGFDFGEVYGERGEGFIECHHTVPVSEMKPGEKTKLSDLVLVCANCHRMIHAKRPWLVIRPPFHRTPNPDNS